MVSLASLVSLEGKFSPAKMAAGNQKFTDGTITFATVEEDVKISNRLNEATGNSEKVGYLDALLNAALNPLNYPDHYMAQVNEVFAGATQMGVNANQAITKFTKGQDEAITPKEAVVAQMFEEAKMALPESGILNKPVIGVDKLVDTGRGSPA